MNLIGLALLSLTLAVAMARPQTPLYSLGPGYNDNTPVVLCANYPYCDDGSLPHLQDEIKALRQRALLIEKVGESIPLQQPNQPFVAIVPSRNIS